MSEHNFIVNAENVTANIDSRLHGLWKHFLYFCT